jgi:hypothetical protein
VVAWKNSSVGTGSRRKKSRREEPVLDSEQWLNQEKYREFSRLKGVRNVTVWLATPTYRVEILVLSY